MGDNYPKVKLAAAQVAPIFLNREKTIEKACEVIIEAGKNGANIIGFPECYVPGFPHWFDFLKLGDAKTKFFYKELFKNAVEVPGKEVDALCSAAKEAQIYVVMGINEKVKNTLGTIYNTQLFIDPSGKIMGKHRKIVPTSTERLVHGQGDGSTLNVFPTEYGELGGLICGENTNSLARFTLIAKGEKIHVASWPAFATKTKQFLHNAIDVRVRFHAFEAKNYVISATGIFSEEMKDILCTSADLEEFVNDGGHSSIIGPTGEVLAGPIDGERILYAEANIENIVEAKMLHDVVGHYNRFDIFKLYVNEEPLSPLVGGKPNA